MRSSSFEVGTTVFLLPFFTLKFVQVPTNKSIFVLGNLEQLDLLHFGIYKLFCPICLPF